MRSQAQAAGIGMPEVAIFDSPDPNAFATGARRNNALVAVSTGLLQRMQREEVEAVLGHEVSHVANGDMVTLALIQGVVNTFVIFLSRVIGHFVDRVVFKTERGHGPAFFITAIVAELVLGILASLIVFWFSRRREFRADAGGARLAGRERMIAALERLRRELRAGTVARPDGGLRYLGRDPARADAAVHDPPPRSRSGSKGSGARPDLHRPDSGARLRWCSHALRRVLPHNPFWRAAERTVCSSRRERAVAARQIKRHHVSASSRARRGPPASMPHRLTASAPPSLLAARHAALSALQAVLHLPEQCG